jgi:TRAP-type mannitol/chloroaromatic compound transport system permease small subunit|tara:strand:+ start:6713 stop:7246 length:534 start_codon:yes stop_codon:yes gene_type:complete
VEEICVTRLTALAQLLDRFSATIGKYISWLALAMVLIQFLLVLARYVFGIGLIALQESVIYSFALLFMVGAADTLRRDGHVRIDILYEKLGEKGRAAINFLGSLFLLIPVCLVILILSWPYVSGSWQIMEGSREGTGLPFLFLLKSLLLVFPITMILQGIATILRSMSVLLRWEDMA